MAVEWLILKSFKIAHLRHYIVKTELYQATFNTILKSYQTCFMLNELLLDDCPQLLNRIKFLVSKAVSTSVQYYKVPQFVLGNRHHDEIINGFIQHQYTFWIIANPSLSSLARFTPTCVASFQLSHDYNHLF